MHNNLGDNHLFNPLPVNAKVFSNLDLSSNKWVRLPADHLTRAIVSRIRQTRVNRHKILQPKKYLVLMESLSPIFAIETAIFVHTLPHELSQET